MVDEKATVAKAKMILPFFSAMEIGIKRSQTYIQTQNGVERWAARSNPRKYQAEGSIETLDRSLKVVHWFIVDGTHTRRINS